MGVTTIRPNSVSNGGMWTTVGGVLPTIVNDNSDATYLHLPVGVGYNQYSPWLGFVSAGQFMLRAYARITNVAVNTRVRMPTGQQSFFEEWVSDSVGAGFVIKRRDLCGYPGHSTINVIHNHTFAMATDPTGKSWTEVLVDGLVLWYRVQGTQTTGNSMYDVFDEWRDITYNLAPTVTLKTPASGSTVVISQPSLVHHYHDMEGDAQERVWIKVFTAAQYGIAGFNPETSPYYWSSGEKFSTSETNQIGVGLPNGTYRAYIKVADAGSSGRYGQANLLTYDETSFETSVAGWTARTNCTIAQSTVAAFEGANSMRVNATAAGTTVVELGRKVPCAVGDRCGMRARFQPVTTARNVRVGLEFFDAANGLLSTVYSPVTLEVAASFIGVENVAVAPVNATQIRPIVEIQANAAAEGHLVDLVHIFTPTQWVYTQFTVSVVAAPVPAITAVADTVNQWSLVTLTEGATPNTDGFQVEYSDDAGLTWRLHRLGNPLNNPNLLDANTASMETSSAGWIAETNVAATYPQKSGTQFLDGLASLQVRAAAAGDMSILSAVRYPVLVANNHAAWAWSYAPVTARSFRIEQKTYDALTGGTLLATYGAANTVETIGSWVLDKEGPNNLVPSYVQLRVVWLGCAINEDHYLDYVKFGRSSQTIQDRELASAISRLYRASAFRIQSGNQLMSAVSGNAGPVSLVYTSWMFRDLTDSTLSINALLLGDAITLERPESLGIFEALGRKTKIAISDVIHGDEISFTFFFQTQAEYDAFQRLAATKRTILVQNPVGEQWYAKFVDGYQITRSGIGNTRKRTVTVKMIEQAVPA